MCVELQDHPAALKTAGTSKSEDNHESEEESMEESGDDSMEESIDSMSEASDGPDASDVHVHPQKPFTTKEDKDMQRIDEIKALLRERPLWPAHPQDPSQSYVDQHSAVRLPLVHCAFKNCTWHADFGDGSGTQLDKPLRQWSLEYCLFQHLIRSPDGHGDVFDPERKAVRAKECRTEEEHRLQTFFRVISFYMKAVAEKEGEGMPLIGVTKDRQILRGIHAAMENVSSQICFCCAQSHTNVALWHRVSPDSCNTFGSDSVGHMKLYSVKRSLLNLYEKNGDCFSKHFGLDLFKKTYCAEEQPGGNPFRDEATFATAVADWKQCLRINDEIAPVNLLCCPEDVVHCHRCRSDDGIICENCLVPLCHTCADCIVHRRKDEIPMVLHKYKLR